jgi:hypothetical protein
MTDTYTFPSLYALRDKLATLGEEISAELSARRRTLAAPADAEHIADLFRRGLDGAARDYEARLTAFFSDPRAGDVAQLLGSDAAIYFMRDLIASKVPALVQRFCPDAERGMPQGDRERVLQETDRKLGELRQRREELIKALSLEGANLRTERMEAIHAGNWRRQVAVESEQRTLSEELEKAQRDQDEVVRQLSTSSLR